jgi:hypothetical protein
MCLTLLVPLAQALATWHAFSHIDGHFTLRSDETSSPQKVCDLCLAAASIGDGGPTSAVHGFAPLALTASSPHAVPVARWLSPPTTGYSSRAPPLSPR